MPPKRPALKTFNDVDIGYKLKISYFVASIIPLAVMTYLYIAYISPLVEDEGHQSVGIVIGGMLVLTILLSVMGLAMSSKAANESISNLKLLNERINSLLDITKTFRESFYVDVLMDSIASSSAALLNAEASSILLFNDEGRLRFEYVSGAMAGSLKGKTLEPGEGVSGWAAKRGEPVIVNDVSRDKRYSGKYDNEFGFKTRSMLCVPLVIEGKTIGVLEVVNKKAGGEFTDQDMRILFSLADHAGLSIQRSRRYETSHSDFIHMTEILLAAMDHHLPVKKGHARRVAKYSVRLGRSIGLGEEEQKKLYFGALLHDIGFLKYDHDDYWGLTKFEMHPAIGYDMIKGVSAWENIAPLVLSHHERYDGGGYPNGISGDDIPIGARIIGITDAFDTMISDSSYKEAVGYERAREEIQQNAGTQFDPELANKFLAEITEKDIEG